MLKEFYSAVVYPNRWKYFIVTLSCLSYAFLLPLTSGVRWYRAEATLLFKNVPDVEFFNAQRLSYLPPPIFYDEPPFENQYDYSGILYSRHIAEKVIGDRFDELYDPKEYDGPLDFYERFLMQAGYKYDPSKNSVTVSFTWKDPELAREFCDKFAVELERYIIDAVKTQSLSTRLDEKLLETKIELAQSEAEMKSVTEHYKVADLLVTPVEWVIGYGESRRADTLSSIKVEASRAALKQLKENEKRRDLLREPPKPPDTMILQDLILAGVRVRLASIRAALEVSSTGLAEDSPKREELLKEIVFLNDFIRKNYSVGLDIERNEILMTLEKYYAEDFITKEISKKWLGKVETLPELEREVRPVVRKVNVATRMLYALEQMINYLEIGAMFDNIPLMLIDHPETPKFAVQPGWKTLSYLLPSGLFLSTLWFGLKRKISLENGIK